MPGDVAYSVLCIFSNFLQQVIGDTTDMRRILIRDFELGSSVQSEFLVTCSYFEKL